MNMQGLLKQAQKMQKELTKLEDELNEKVYETTMGGGVIKVEVKGSMSVESISIYESLLEKDNKEDLEDMLKSALNDAFAKAVEDKEKNMNKITGGVKMPGGF
ncbi:YbaB/EbfC family nucleoid-associated protein [[Clostridium] innocuum]|nr:YbaB/EbfC family nucleoid-associated protein [[Clostridium] innocuum]